jgi:hypothetical protein
MMGKLFIMLLLTCFLAANEHFAKVEPFESVTIKAEASGEVVEAKKALEGTVANGVILRIDDLLNKKDLNSTLESLALVKKMIEVNSDMVEALKKNVIRKRALFEKVNPLSTASVNQKDSLYSAYVAAKSQYNGVLEKILSLKNQKVTLEQKANLLKDTIEKKTIAAKSKYLYRLMVNKGEFVTVGMPLATLQSIDRGKLTLFLSKDELDGIQNKSIYIDGKKSDLKVDKVWRVADAQYISSYRVEIVMPHPKEFSKLVKVEFK